MFFSQELLARRDSGFGLLWLAATLGSKSTFKKLPKKSVLDADISQLCSLIAQPEEPLALRLSSNLMVGVARVYKVKQEIFLTDVTNCVSSLKKVVQDLQTAAAKEKALQMAQPTMRSSALTLADDPHALFIADFDALVDNWDVHLNIQEPESREDLDDQEFNPHSKRQALKPTSKASVHSEDLRAEACTLKEHHDHLLSQSFDLSFQGSTGEMDVSSSQAGPVFMLDDNFLLSDGLGLDGGLGDELARELGEGWGAPPTPARGESPPVDMNMDLDINFNENAIDIAGGDFNFAEPMAKEPIVRASSQPPVLQTPVKVTSRNRKENATPRSRRRVTTPLRSPAPPSPANSFTQLLLSQGAESEHCAPTPLTDITANARSKENQPPSKKQKRTRLLLDARTELTDEELKIARAKYVEEQHNQRRELDSKKIEKNSGKIVEELIWGVPTGIDAPALVDFWQENFRVQVEARTGAVHMHPDEFQPKTPPTKRRKLQAIEEVPEEPFYPDLVQNDFGYTGAGDIARVYDTEPLLDGNIDFDPEVRLRSSEEPGQARNASRQPSVAPNFSFDLSSNEKLTGSQLSSLFPWDNAGADISSSVGGAFGGGSERVAFDPAEVKIRGSSVSKREGSLPLSQNGSITAARGISPGDFGRNSQVFGEDFELRVDEVPTNQQSDTQRSDLNLVTLERNSFNFLEYVKMQQQAMPIGSGGHISFDTIAPKATSTRRVAAAAFYHCLVLTTKDLLRVTQNGPYGFITVNTKP
ncbi:rad21 rec8 n terminal domain protein [Moniliophthora roreri MCA 2997]|uniref:Rad21 rec8 n terminal domain protein n=1 Tax=Moniliophthora roreri (strain MCA 2997) TaxID=1381753 RepID=V2Y4S5_MONRO|nr:rad21 rec8 n terminal domain protein [Moniliophthora roreri MCA 2997]